MCLHVMDTFWAHLTQANVVGEKEVDKDVTKFIRLWTRLTVRSQLKAYSDSKVGGFDCPINFSILVGPLL